MQKKTKDWLDLALDCHPGATAPATFLEDVRGHLNLIGSPVFLWSRRIAIIAAAALLWFSSYLFVESEGNSNRLDFAARAADERLDFYEDPVFLDSWSRLEDWDGVVLAMAHEDPLVRRAVFDAGQQLARRD